MNLDCFIIFYNQENFVEQRLNNIFKILPVKNITIINDHSIDNTLEKIKRFLFKKKIKSNLINNSHNKGILKNWKFCAETATKDDIWILEGDDLTDRNFLKRYKIIKQSHNDIDIFSGVTYSINDKNEITGKQTKNIFKKLNLKFLINEEVTRFSELNFILSILNLFPNIGSLIFNKNVFKENLFKLNGKDLLVNYAFDWILYYIISQNENLKFYFDFKAINYFKIHDKNFSEQHDKSKKVREIKLAYNFFDKYQNNQSIELVKLRERYINSLK